MKKTPPLPCAMFLPTLSVCLEYADNYFFLANAVPSNEEWKNVFCFGGLKYGETKSADCELLSYKNKPTRKFGHVTVWRDEKGLYEVNTYIL